MAFNPIFYALVWFIATVFIKDNLKRGYRLSMVLSICAGAVVVLLVADMGLFVYVHKKPFGGFNPEIISRLRYVLWGVGLLDLLIATGIRKVIMARISKRNPTKKNLILGLMKASLLYAGEACTLTVYGVILFLVGGRSLDLYLLAFVSLILLALHFPRYSHWEKWAAQAESGPAMAPANGGLKTMTGSSPDFNRAPR